MNTDKPDIGIIYGKGSFKDSELEALANEFATHGLSLAAKERSPFINAAVDFFVPFLQIDRDAFENLFFPFAPRRSHNIAHK